jgi:hypothetical protein
MVLAASGQKWEDVRISTAEWPAWKPSKCLSISIIILRFNPFPAEVANKFCAPKSHFCDLTGKTEVIGLSHLLTNFLLTCGVYIYIKQTQGAFNVLKKHTKLIENRFSRSNVIQNSID